MSTNASGFTGDIPTHYDRGLGPHIFNDYADHLVDRCCERAALDVLEIAAGTGIVSRKLRDNLAGDAQLIVTDLNKPMLAVAQGKFAASEDITFAVANAMELPFDDNTFDLMVCQFGVMFFPDKPASFREAARVLRAGGRYVFSVWGPMADNPFSQMAHDVGVTFFPENPPGFYKVPFHYGASDKVLADLAAGGWHDVDFETIKIQKTITHPESFANALVYGNPLIDEIRDRGGVDPNDVVDAMLAALTKTFGPKNMTMPLSATTFVCRAP